MNELKRQEIKNVVRSLWDNYDDKLQLAKVIITLYIESSNEHYNIDDIYYSIIPEIERDIISEQPIVLNKWFDPACAKRITLSDTSVKNIAIDALSLIQYVQSNGLTIENIEGYVRVYVNYILPEHQAIFESFGGVMEDNPYPTTTALDSMLVADLNEFYDTLGHEIEGFSSMLKAEKVAALKKLIYNI